MRFATCCCLLLALASTTSLAQIHPKKKRAHRPVITDKPAQVARQVKEWECSLPFEVPQDSTVEVEAAPNRIYTYVEQMPTLPGASGMAGIVAALQQLVVVPPAAPAGRVFVQFVVTKEGAVSQPHILKGLRADVDSAVVEATRQLPRFIPGKQSHQVVPVSIAVAVTFPVAQRP